MYVMEIEGCELSKRNFPEEEVDLDWCWNRFFPSFKSKRCSM
jgi:hypothetical protein